VCVCVCVCVCVTVLADKELFSISADFVYFTFIQFL